MEESVAKKGFFNMFCGLLGQVISVGLGVVVPRLVMVKFGSEVNGLLNSIMQIFIYFSLFEAGIGAASLQALYAPVATKRKTEINAIIAATHNFYKKTGTIYAVAVIVLAFVYPFFVSSDINYWIIVGVILMTGLGNCFTYFYQGKFRILMQAEGYNYITINITTIINVLANMAKVTLLLSGFNVVIVQLSFFVVYFIQMLIYMVYVKKHYKWVDITVKPDTKIYEQTKATLIHQISTIIFNNTDVIMLTVLTRNLKIVSIYAMYNYVVTMVTMLIQQVSGGFDFRLGQLYNTERELYMKLHHVFEILYLVIVFSAMTVIYIFVIPFMRLYTSGVDDINYINNLYPLFFTLAPILVYGRLSVSNLINYAGHFKKTQWRAVAETVINIVISIFGILRFGIFGALFGSIVAALYRTNDMIFYSYKHLLKGNPIKTYKRWLICIVPFALVVAFVKPDINMFNSYISIILYATVCAIICMLVYMGLQLLFNPIERRELISVIKGYLPKKNRQTNEQ